MLSFVFSLSLVSSSSEEDLCELKKCSYGEKCVADSDKKVADCQCAEGYTRISTDADYGNCRIFQWAELDCGAGDLGGDCSACGNASPGAHCEIGQPGAKAKGVCNIALDKCIENKDLFDGDCKIYITPTDNYCVGGEHRDWMLGQCKLTCANEEKAKLLKFETDCAEIKDEKKCHDNACVWDKPSTYCSSGKCLEDSHCQEGKECKVKQDSNNKTRTTIRICADKNGSPKVEAVKKDESEPEPEENATVKAEPTTKKPEQPAENKKAREEADGERKEIRKARETFESDDHRACTFGNPAWADKYCDDADFPRIANEVCPFSCTKKRKDKHHACKAWAEAGHCGSDKNFKDVRLNACLNSCRTKDVSPNCSDWKDECEKNPDVRLILCRGTCKTPFDEDDDSL